MFFNRPGDSQVYFNQLNYFNLQTFIIHMLLTMVIYLICGLCAFQFYKYHRIQVQQTEQMDLLQEAARLSIVHEKNAEALEEWNTILEVSVMFSLLLIRVGPWPAGTKRRKKCC